MTDPAVADVSLDTLAVTVLTGIGNDLGPIEIEVPLAALSALVARAERAENAWQEAEHPFDKSEYDAMFARVQRAENALRLEMTCYIAIQSWVDEELWKGRRRISAVLAGDTAALTEPGTASRQKRHEVTDQGSGSASAASQENR